MIIEAFFAFYLSLVEYNIFRLIIYAKHLVNSKTSSTFAPRKGEVLEWLKRHAWKACIPQKGIRGSNPRLSARQKRIFYYFTYSESSEFINNSIFPVTYIAKLFIHNIFSSSNFTVSKENYVLYYFFLYGRNKRCHTVIIG